MAGKHHRWIQQFWCLLIHHDWTPHPPGPQWQKLSVSFSFLQLWARLIFEGLEDQCPVSNWITSSFELREISSPSLYHVFHVFYPFKATFWVLKPRTISNLAFSCPKILSAVILQLVQKILWETSCSEKILFRPWHALSEGRNSSQGSCNFRDESALNSVSFSWSCDPWIALVDLCPPQNTR